MSKRILIIEDEESIAELERDYLELSGFDVEVANDGDNGLNLSLIHILPKMDIELPILLGANEENMSSGAVHLTGTSYPIGGVNTNCVIAAHRGYSRTAMFRDIEALEVGDKIYIENFREKLIYQVTELRIIEPTDIDKLLIQEGKDMVTLVTCHPYGYNYQRYVVFCERVKNLSLIHILRL